MASVITCAGKEVEPNPLANPRLEYTFGIGIRTVENVRYCIVSVEVSKRLLDTLRKRDGANVLPCLVVRKRVPGIVGFPVNPTSFELRRSVRPAWLNDHVSYEVALPYDYLYGGNIDIQAMTFEMMPAKVVDWRVVPETI